MKGKNIIIVILLLAVAFFGVVVIMAINQTKTSSESSNNNPSATKPDEGEPEPIDIYADRIEDQLAEMTLDEKIAQLLIVQPNSNKLAHQYGGIILMEPNYSTLAGTKQLVQDLQKTSKLPLIVSTDQEGGSVQRLQKITDRRATYIPEMYRLGSANDPELTYDVGRVLAEELRVIGVNVAFAPVLDIYSNSQNRVIGHRSFSSNRDVVSNMGLKLAAGLFENGVIPTYKHFPGHGDTATDSHYSLPIIQKDYNQLAENELVPFQNAIAAGAQIIMVGHIALPKVTGDNTPATLSHKITTGILRNKLGYEGLIVTDGLNMGALTNNYSESEIYWRAVEAGADLLLLPRNANVAIKSIRDHVKEERIDESVRRILRFKYQYLENYEQLDDSYFGSVEHSEVVKRVP